MNFRALLPVSALLLLLPSCGGFCCNNGTNSNRCRKPCPTYCATPTYSSAPAVTAGQAGEAPVEQASQPGAPVPMAMSEFEEVRDEDELIEDGAEQEEPQATSSAPTDGKEELDDEAYGAE